MDIDKLIPLPLVEPGVQSFSSLMDIDKLIRRAQCAARPAGFSSLMDIDKLNFSKRFTFSL